MFDLIVFIDMMNSTLSKVLLVCGCSLFKMIRHSKATLNKIK